MLMKTVRSKLWLRFVYHLEIPLPPSPLLFHLPPASAELKSPDNEGGGPAGAVWAEDEDDLSSVVPGLAGWLAGWVVGTDTTAAGFPDTCFIPDF